MSMSLYRCLCGQPLAAFVVPFAGLPVGERYVRAAVADALAAHVERLERDGTAEEDLHGVVSDQHGDGEPWVLSAGRVQLSSDVDTDLSRPAMELRGSADVPSTPPRRR